MGNAKKTDYSNSAVQLCNPPRVAEFLAHLIELKHEEAIMLMEIERTSLFKELTAKRNVIAAQEQFIRQAIDEQGSYQDLDAGNYAIKQRKLSVTYIASKVREFLRDYADAVIEEVVSRVKLEGLRKGGLVSQDDLDRCADTTESFAYIIKTG